MEEYKRTFRSLNVGIDRIATALRQKGYELGVQGSKFITYEKEDTRLFVGSFDIFHRVDSLVVLITANTDMPEGRNLSEVLQKLDIS